MHYATMAKTYMPCWHVALDYVLKNPLMDIGVLIHTGLLVNRQILTEQKHTEAY